MKTAESTVRYPPGDRPATEPGGRQVRHRHNRMPSRGKGEHRPITVQVRTHDACANRVCPFVHAGGALSDTRGANDDECPELHGR